MIMKGWVIQCINRKGEIVNTEGPHGTESAALAVAETLLRRDASSRKRHAVKTTRVEKRRCLKFSDFRKTSIADQIDGCVDIGGRKKRWVGFGVVDEGPATPDLICIVEG